MLLCLAQMGFCKGMQLYRKLNHFPSVFLRIVHSSHHSGWRGYLRTLGLNYYEDSMGEEPPAFASLRILFSLLRMSSSVSTFTLTNLLLSKSSVYLLDIWLCHPRCRPTLAPAQPCECRDLVHPSAINTSADLISRPSPEAPDSGLALGPGQPTWP